jgi:hypothetical protein
MIPSSSVISSLASAARPGEEDFDVILATPEGVLVSQQTRRREFNFNSKMPQLYTIDIMFQSHFIAHLTRSNARDHATPNSGPATTS